MSTAKKNKTADIFNAVSVVPMTAVRANMVRVILLFVRRAWFTASKLLIITAVSAREKRSLLVITTMANMCVTKTGHNAAQPVQITPVPVVPIAKSID